ncbi:TIGR04452 family lipoprotein [Leptospira sp. WS92.C1]
MKTDRSLFLLFLFFFQCAYVDINPSLVSGTEAKEIISDRLLVNQIIHSIGLNQAEPNRSYSTTALVFTFLIPDSIGIDEKQMYQKEAVNECADQIFFVSLTISTQLSFFVCKASNPPISIPFVSKKI